VVQVKKELVRNRILATAELLFQKQGYIATTMAQVAKRARVASATIYVYFPSKLDVALALFEPWLNERMSKIELEVRAVRDSRTRLDLVLTRLWRDIPLEQNNYINCLMEALAISSKDEHYKPIILYRMRDQIRKLIDDCIPEARRKHFDTAAFAHIAVMAFDGFVINGHLNPSAMGDGVIVRAACDLILGTAAGEISARAKQG
jgi:AcrR family transcriptional regulator